MFDPPTFVVRLSSLHVVCLISENLSAVDIRKALDYLLLLRIPGGVTANVFPFTCNK